MKKRLNGRTAQWLLLAVMSVFFGGCGRQGVEPPSVTVENNDKNPMTVQVPMRVGGAVLRVEIRDDADERALGLSYRTDLGEDEGMVFVFDRPGPQRFWMQGMHFPLDMIWIREGRVVEISENVPAPAGEREAPAIVQPDEQVDMVLEVGAGWAERHEVEVGDEVLIEGMAN